LSSRHLLFAAALLLSQGALAATCTSDAAPRPVAVVERFINADCESCWRDAATPAAGRGELAIDWILPGGKGDDAPLSMGALPDGLERLQALKRAAPAQADAHMQRVLRGPRPRIAQGEPFNDYIGTSLESPRASGGPFTAWLLLIEALPTGAEGSPVARNLVRNSFHTAWSGRGPLAETRSMQIHEGTQVSRLRLVALVQDARGRLVGAVQSHCTE
jgi:hypothetical protein